MLCRGSKVPSNIVVIWYLNKTAGSLIKRKVGLKIYLANR
jgi:hypothetical protein